LFYYAAYQYEVYYEGDYRKFARDKTMSTKTGPKKITGGVKYEKMLLRIQAYRTPIEVGNTHRDFAI